MKVIVGLGNPGARYRKTRHNLGFWILDALATEAGIPWKRKRKLMAWLGHGDWKNERLIIVKPTTYVNASGRAVRAVMDYYGVRSGDLLVVVDDVNLRAGMIRIRPRGGPGGHHGLESVIRSLGTTDFARIRVGIGGGELDDLTAHVLSSLSREEAVRYQQVVAGVIEAMAGILQSGIEKAMNRSEERRVGKECRSRWSRDH